MKTKFVVLTGGPGAGKTAVLELAKRRFTRDTAFLPEAASLIFFRRILATSQCERKNGGATCDLSCSG